MLEHFEGFVECVRDNVAYLTLRSDNGKKFYATHPNFSSLGIRERRRFHLNIKDDGDLEWIDIPDIELTPEQEWEIDEEIDRLLGGEYGN